MSINLTRRTLTNFPLLVRLESTSGIMYVSRSLSIVFTIFSVWARLCWHSRSSSQQTLILPALVQIIRSYFEISVFNWVWCEIFWIHCYAKLQEFFLIFPLQQHCFKERTPQQKAEPSLGHPPHPNRQDFTKPYFHEACNRSTCSRYASIHGLERCHNGVEECVVKSILYVLEARRISICSSVFSLC